MTARSTSVSRPSQSVPTSSTLSGSVMSDPLQGVDGAREILELDPASEVVVGTRDVGTQERPGVGAEELLGRAFGRVQVDAAQGEPVACDVSQHRTEAVVDVEDRLPRHRDGSLHALELRDPVFGYR